MVCPFSVICEHYDDVHLTCRLDDGGPFDSFTGEAYCGDYRCFVSALKVARAIKAHGIRGIRISLLVEA